MPTLALFCARLAIRPSFGLSTLSPAGWTREEVYALKICLMRFGVGKWVQITNSGILPGKLIQQLNGQTQRLLGQQSLAGAVGSRRALHCCAPAR